MPAQRRAAAAEPAEAQAAGPRVLKKYPNRRLYDTRSSSYITLADVKDMVLKLEDFEVRDAKSGEDLTRSILLQIILEEESGGVPMFSSQMLAQMIRFYGHSMQGMMGAYLEKNLQTFVELQKRFAATGVGLNDGKNFTPEMWAQFMTGPGQCDAGHDDGLHGAVEEPVHADAGADGQAGRHAVPGHTRACRAAKR